MAKKAAKSGGAKPHSPARARLSNRLIFGLALFGILVTIHLWVQSERGFSRGCFGLEDPAEVGIVECTAVVQSDAGKLFGISNIIYGFFFFSVLATLSFATVLSKGDTTAKLRRISFAVASVGVLYALYLFFFQVFMLGQFCKLCLITGLTTAVIFGVHAVEWAGKTVPSWELPDLVRELGTFLAMILVTGLLAVALTLFVNRLGTLEVAEAMGAPPPSETPSAQFQSPPMEQPAAPDAAVDGGDSVAPDTDENVAAGDVVAAATEDASDDAGSDAAAEEARAAEEAAQRARLEQMCRYDESMASVPNAAALTRNAPTYGDGGGEVAIIEIFDPNCPHCKTLHENTPAIMSQVAGRAQLYYRPFPIWPYSYMQVEALYAAEDQGKFDEMMTAQMARQKRGGLSFEELADIAEDIGLDEDRFRNDLNAGKYRSRVNRERAQIAQLGVNSVPRLMLDGRFVQSSSIHPACIDFMVEQIEAGG